MLDALEKISRKRVNADNASHSYHYICPECLTPVILREGNVRSAYFAHAPGVSNEDCALFASQIGANVYTLPGGSHEENETAMRLCLRLSRSREGYSWGVELVVPTLRLSYGSISIDAGERINEIRLDGNTASTRTIPVEPQNKPYTIVTTNPRFGPLASIHKKCPGLEIGFATVFGDILGPDAAKIRLASEFRKERTYAVIWHEQFAPPIFPDELCVEHMATRQGWCGAVFHIPYCPSTDCQDWLIQFTNLKFTAATPAIVPVWPPLLRSVTARLIEAPSNQTTFFFVEHNKSDHTLPLFARCQHSERVAQGDVHNAPFYRLSPENSRSVQLVCRKTDGLEIDIDFSMSSLTAISGNAVILLGKNKDGIASQVPLHSKDAGIWINKVRNGEIQFLALSLPRGISGKVRCGRKMSWIALLNFGEDKVGTVALDSPMSEHSAAASKISDWLCDRTLDVLVDFGGFGRTQVIATDSSMPAQSGLIPANIALKVKYYFRQFPKSAQIPKNWQLLNMRDLAKQLKLATPSGESLIHHRVLMSQIEKTENQLVGN